METAVQYPHGQVHEGDREGVRPQGRANRKGLPNKVTVAWKDFCKLVLTDLTVQQRILQDARDGKLPPHLVVNMAAHYAGRPPLTVITPPPPERAAGRRRCSPACCLHYFSAQIVRFQAQLPRRGRAHHSQPPRPHVGRASDPQSVGLGVQALASAGGSPRPGGRVLRHVLGGCLLGLAAAPTDS